VGVVCSCGHTTRDKLDALLTLGGQQRSIIPSHDLAPLLFSTTLPPNLLCGYPLGGETLKGQALLNISLYILAHHLQAALSHLHLLAKFLGPV